MEPRYPPEPWELASWEIDAAMAVRHRATTLQERRKALTRARIAYEDLGDALDAMSEQDDAESGQLRLMAS